MTLGLLVLSGLLGCSEPVVEGPPVAVLAQELARGSTAGSVMIASRQVGDDDFAALLDDERFPDLRTLGLDDNDLTVVGVTLLSGSGRCSSLEWLNLSRNPIGDAGVAALASGPCWGSIRRLFLHGSEVGPAGARALAGAPGSALRFLSAGSQPLGDDGAEALAALDAVRHLEVGEAHIGGKGAKALLSRSRAAVLVLDGNPIGPGGLTGLKALGPNLQELSLRGAGLTLADVQALAAVTPPPTLVELDVTGNPLGDAGMLALAALPWLQQLEKIRAEGSGAALPARQALVDAWGVRSGIKVERR